MSDNKPVYDEVKFAHIPSTAEQTLAALLRIEELLTAQLEGLRFLAKSLSPSKDEAKAEKVAPVAPRRRG